MKRRRVYLWVFVLLTAGLLLVGCLARPIETVEDPVVGTWHGTSEVRLPIEFTPSEIVAPEDIQSVPVKINITINADGTVTGRVGDATLQACILKKNRGELGRRLNIASDFLIADGYLEGSLIPGDEVTKREFTIPFDIVDGKLHGSIMWLEEWKYPKPLMEIDLDPAG